MGKRSKKPRPKFDAKHFEPTVEAKKKEEKDWTFEDIARSKTRRR